MFLTFFCITQACTQKTTTHKRHDAFKRKKNYFTSSHTSIADKRLNRIESFKFVDVGVCPEFEAFTSSVNDLKLRVDVTQKALENLIVFSPLLDSPLSQASNGHSSVRVNIRTSESPSNPRATLSVSLNATVETLVYTVLTTFNIDDLDTNKYLLKIHGLEEYLPVNAALNELKHVHECLIENREPVLVLVELKHVNTQLSTKEEEGVRPG